MAEPSGVATGGAPSFPATTTGPWAHRLDAAGTATYVHLLPADETAQAGLRNRTLTALYNDPPSWLRELHDELDRAALDAYGWPADASEQPILAHLLAGNARRGG
jgi:hypothetical protein